MIYLPPASNKKKGHKMITIYYAHGDLKKQPKIIIRRLLKLFTRDLLREIARKINIPIGRNKKDTITSIINNLDKISTMSTRIQITIDK